MKRIIDNIHVFSILLDRAGRIVDKGNDFSRLLVFDQVDHSQWTAFKDYFFCERHIFPLLEDDKLRQEDFDVVFNPNGILKEYQPDIKFHMTLKVFKQAVGDDLVFCSLVQDLANNHNYHSEHKEVITEKFRNSLLPIFQGSVLLIDRHAVIKDVLWNGPYGLVFSFGLQQNVSILSLLSKKLADYYGRVLTELEETGTLRRFSQRFVGRFGELYIDGCIYKYSDNEFVLNIVDCTRQSKIEKERLGFSLFPYENPNPVMRVNRFGRISFANDSALRLLKNIGNNTSRLVNQELRAVIKKVCATGNSDLFKLRVGKETYQMNFIKSLKDNQVNIYGTLVTVAERSLEKLRRQSLYMKSIINATGDSIVLVTKKHEILFYNRSTTELAMKMVGNPVSSWRNITDFIPSQFVQQFKLVSKQIADGDLDHFESELKVASLKGELCYFLIRITPVMDKATGQFLGLCMFFSDITAVKKINIEVVRQRNFYESILNNLPTDIAVFDPDHRYLFINPHGVKDDNLRAWMIGKTDYDYAAMKGLNTVMADSRRAYFNKAIQSRESIMFEDKQVKDGNLKYLLRKFYPVVDKKLNSVTMVLGYGLDVSSIKESEQSALRSEEKLRKANLVLERFNDQLLQYSSIVSHNLRAPVANLLGLMDFFEKDIPGGESNNMLIDQMLSSVQRMDRILKDLNEILAMRDTSKLKFEQIPLKPLLMDLTDELREIFRNAHVELEIQIASDISVYGVKAYMRSILYNLLSNAVKYRDREKETPRVSVHIKQTIDTTVLTVEDNGLGIDLKRHGDKLFGLYKRFHEKVAEGSGMGLHIVKSQVQIMDGNIQVFSQPGVGTRFELTLNNQPHGRSSID
jgi:signal transduction histidine kinase/PAS domain-containing protein